MSPNCHQQLIGRERTIGTIGYCLENNVSIVLRMDLLFSRTMEIIEQYIDQRGGADLGRRGGRFCQKKNLKNDEFRKRITGYLTLGQRGGTDLDR